MSTLSNQHSLEDTSTKLNEVTISRGVRFWLILPFYIPSLICSFFVLYYFLTNRTMRRALHNHVIALLLVINLIILLIDIPWLLNYFRLGYVWPQTPLLCLVWIFTDESLHITTNLLFAWATIERHILVFHDRWMASRHQFILIHCSPVVIILLYCICYNSITVIFPPCKNTFDYTKMVCGYPFCYYEVQSLAIWDIVVNHMIPTVIIIVCSIALLLRVVYRKRTRNQPIRWRKYRKMTIQLLSISVLYLILYIPGIITEFLQFCGVLEEADDEFLLYSNFFAYYCNFLLPFVCAGSMPELRTKLKKIFACFWRERRPVGPQSLTMSPSRAIQQLEI